jgi:hypothetical protein
LAELMTALPEPLFSDPATIRCAIDQRSTFLTDMDNNPLITFTLIGACSVFAIYGTARVSAELLEGVPTKLACFDVDNYSVREAMFYGPRIVTEPEYEKSYDKRAAEKLDGQVFETIKKA